VTRVSFIERITAMRASRDGRNPLQDSRSDAPILEDET
jgi:hypothetical protein